MKLLTSADWMRRLTVLADDERARQHHPEVDCEHLFLALLSLGGPVTTALAEAGVTLDAARAELAVRHAERIAGLGITIEAPEPNGPIPPYSARGQVDYSDRALSLMRSIPFDSGAAASLAAWKALRDEPSVDVDGLLARLGADADAIERSAAAHADDAATPTHGRKPHRDGHWSEYRTFVTAPPDELWALISDPARWMEWNGSEHTSARVLDDGTVETRQSRRRRGGADEEVSESESPREISHYTVLRSVPGQIIEWTRTSPGTDFRWLLQITATPEGSGMSVGLAYRYDFPAGRPRGPFKALGTRATRFFGRFYLRSKADDISRALR